jgi:hypothetical protein
MMKAASWSKGKERAVICGQRDFFGVSFEFMALHGIGVSPNEQK